MKKLVISILALLLLSLTVTTAAQDITVSSVVVTGQAGRSVSGTTTVKNNAGHELILHVDKIKLLGEIDATKKIPADMITVTPAEFALDPNEEKTVQITVNIPQGLKSQLYSGEFVVTDWVKSETFNVFVHVQDAAAADTAFNIEEIEVDGVEVSSDSGQTIFVERGTNVDVRVEFKSNIDSDRVKVKSWIGGFEFGDVQDATEIFTVEPGLIYVKNLNLEIPDDIDLDEDEFRLHVEIFDNEGSQREETFKLGIRKERHNINILDTIFYPSNTVEAGRALRTVVRVENLGEQKEEDVLVKVSIPELGLSTKAFIDELVSEEPTSDDSEETSESSDELILFIPKDARSGEYLVEIEVEFNRGHDTITQKKSILVEGVETTALSKAIISVDMTSQNIAKGSEVPYKFMVANLGNTKTLYSAEVEGVSAWGVSRVSPSFVSVDQGEAGEVFVFVKANEGASTGQQNFRVNILSEGVKVKEVNLNANIVDSTAAEKGTGFQNTQRALEIGFVVLVIILVILGLVIAFRRTGNKSRNTSNDTETVEGQTYY